MNAIPTTSDKMDEKKKIEKTKEVFTCKFCNSDFTNFQVLNTHIIRRHHHPDNLKKIIVPVENVQLKSLSREIVITEKQNEVQHSMEIINEIAMPLNVSKEMENDSLLIPMASESETIIIPSINSENSTNSEPVPSTSNNQLPNGVTLFSGSVFNTEQDECVFCGIKFDYICFVSAHCVLVHPKQFTSCLFCYMPFKDYESVKNHCYKVHPSDVTPYVRRESLVNF